MKRCKDCAPGSKRNATNPGPRCATHWREELNRRKSVQHEARALKVYGLGAGEYDALYASQGGRCAICRRATGATRKLSIDHDHATGEVRGLLCRPCNNLLGHARDELEFFKRAYHYLVNPPYLRFRKARDADRASGTGQ